MITCRNRALIKGTLIFAYLCKSKKVHDKQHAVKLYILSLRDTVYRYASFMVIYDKVFWSDTAVRKSD